MSLDTYEVEWLSTQNAICKTRVYPGDFDSAAKFVAENEKTFAKLIAVRKEVKHPIHRTCGYCRQPRVDRVEITYEERR